MAVLRVLYVWYAVLQTYVYCANTWKRLARKENLMARDDNYEFEGREVLYKNSRASTVFLTTKFTTAPFTYTTITRVRHLPSLPPSLPASPCPKHPAPHVVQRGRGFTYVQQTQQIFCQEHLLQS